MHSVPLVLTTREATSTSVEDVEVASSRSMSSAEACSAGSTAAVVRVLSRERSATRVKDFIILDCSVRAGMI